MTAYTLVSAPHGLPLFGHASRLLIDPNAFLASLPAYGDLVQIKLGLERAIVVCHPELTHQILVDDRTFDKGGPLVDRGRELFGDSLAICRHAQHRRQRRLIQPAFHKTRLPRYASAMTARIAAITDRWEDGAVLDVRANMRAFTSHVAVATMFGATLSEADLEQMLGDLSILLAGTFKRMLLPKAFSRIPIPGNRIYERSRQRLRDTLGQCIGEYRNTGTDHGDALSILLAAQDTDGNFTDAEVIDQLVILFVGGSDTTANTLSWALDLLGHHPDVERRLHDEVDEVLGGRYATFTDLADLPWTAQIVTETLRLYPPVAMVTRTVTADAELGGHHIAEGSTLIYSALAVQHRPDLFARPEEFDPDRWTPPGPDLPRGALTPFGGGPRKCIGDGFGMTMATLALASIAAKWRLRTLPGTRVRPILRTFLAPRDLRMTVHRRAWDCPSHR
jgi:cytochrome P450